MPGTHRHRLTLLLIAAALLATPGCKWLRDVFREHPGQPLLPQVLSENPSLEEIVTTVNANSAKIDSFTTDGARITGERIPGLSDTTIAFQRPRYLRVRAGLTFGGPQVDIGSNNQRFWFWQALNEPPVIYYCDHRDFQRSENRQKFPVQPEWFIQALGVVEFEPGGRHEGPFPYGPRRVEIRSFYDTPSGTSSKVTIVEPQTAAVWEQHFYDPRGDLLASTQTIRHWRDPATGAIMPHVVMIHCPRFDTTFEVNLGELILNTLPAASTDLFAMPSPRGAQPVDLCASDACLPMPSAASMPQDFSPTPPQQNLQSFLHSEDDRSYLR